ncbi:MAG: glucans biosynthesis glucosyltransferase MdoH [Pseudohongiella sp.]|nr:glucans biosynthesis glucosyltransferase MdoH [Pseudohongiella sp.]
MDPITVTSNTPPAAPMDMPAQDLSKAPGTRFRRQSFATFLARLLTFGGALALTAYAAHQMYLIISLTDVTALQWLLLVLFVITFGWIALAASSAIAGLFLGHPRPKAAKEAKPQGKTALLMPVYNEDPAATCAALHAMASALIAKQLHNCFEIFIISDSTDPAVWVKETAAVAQLRQELQNQIPVWYRRRYHNTARKAGNVEDFVTRWGARYEYMIVLDADSLIAADTLSFMVREMDADAHCGILQTLPRLYAGKTLFARLQQFAGTLYGPVVAHAITAWQGDDGNYWGHNAIIRTHAFASAAGLPVMPGPRPFGGHIMSHDFVEAALIRRAGWSVRMMPAQPGSWEESPPTLLDSAIRDRRWAQGNMQHLGVIPTKGMRWPNRVHMMIGVMSYLASPLWLAMMTVGLVISGQIATQEFVYFTEEFQLFPNWPVFDSQRMIELFIFTMGVLLLPKAIGFLAGLFRRDIRQGLGPIRLALSVFVELLFSILFAPIFMMIHTRQLWEIVRGKDSGWSTQQRDSHGTDWKLMFSLHWFHTAMGLAVTGVLVWLENPLLYWMLPTVVGLILAIPLSALSGSKSFGNFLAWLGLLRIPEEAVYPPEMQDRDKCLGEFRETVDHVTLESLVADPSLADRHFTMAGSLPPARRGQPDMDAAGAKLKLADAHSLTEAVSWMNRRELMATLTDAELFSSLCQIQQRANPGSEVNHAHSPGLAAASI